ncbi:MAG TPA: DUF222 domain-containing protein, partial [Acidimicrobiia bacterium]|nr:DUF222 domain-containing protein [Acidimicrobiia bacterium]
MFAAIRAALEEAAEHFDADLVDPDTAEAVLDDAVAIRNIAATLESLAADRLTRSRRDNPTGDRSAAEALARRSGTSVSQAKQVLETGRRLRQCPDTAAAARRGQLSPQQAAAITDAASVDPDAEGRLLEQARRGSLQELRDECARTKAKVIDLEERRRRIH